MSDPLGRNKGNLSYADMKIWVDGRPEERYIQDCDVILQDSSHAVVQITVWYTQPRKDGVLAKDWKPDLGYWREGSLAHLRWGWFPRGIQDFYGYVEGRRARKMEDDESKVLVTYIIRGTSRPMQSYKQKTWGNVTASYVARQIAKDYGLRPVVDRSDIVYSGLAQAASDFKFLVDLANRTGYRLFINNASLHFIDPIRALHETRSGYPTFRMDRIPGQQDTLKDLEPETGALLSGGQAVDRVMFVTDQVTGESIQVKRRYRGLGSVLADPNVDTTLLYNDRPAGSYAEGQRLLEAQAKANRLWITAVARTTGDSRIVPGSIINLQGDALSDYETGLWYVIKVTHSLDRETPAETRSVDYELHLTLGRDSQARDVSHAPTPDWLEAQTPPAMAAINGRWRSADPRGSLYV